MNQLNFFQRLRESIKFFQALGTEELEEAYKENVPMLPALEEQTETSRPLSLEARAATAGVGQMFASIWWGAVQHLQQAGFEDETAVNIAMEITSRYMDGLFHQQQAHGGEGHSEDQLSKILEHLLASAKIGPVGS